MLTTKLTHVKDFALGIEALVEALCTGPFVPPAGHFPKGERFYIVYKA